MIIKERNGEVLDFDYNLIGSVKEKMSKFHNFLAKHALSLLPNDAHYSYHVANNEKNISLRVSIPLKNPKECREIIYKRFSMTEVVHIYYCSWFENPAKSFYFTFRDGFYSVKDNSITLKDEVVASFENDSFKVNPQYKKDALFWYCALKSCL